jgi:ActR/RegA family two-component response regulator
MAFFRMLFVDDEPNIRLTLPHILRMHGFDVEVASTVTEALTAIQSRKFDVLVSDLNIGNAGDGFTVVSAMRRTQPDCVTLILTGYPGFETALQAIRNQVDDYLVKPTKIEQLVKTIEDKLKHRSPHEPPPVKRVSVILKEYQDQIAERTITALNARTGRSEEELAEGMAALVSALLEGLDPDLEENSFSEAAAHGRLRREQGWKTDDLFDEFRTIERVAYDVLQENLLATDVSNLVPDLKLFNDHVQNVLRYAVNAHLETRVAA